MLTTYRFSVIIPLEYHRGKTLECLRAWTRLQTLPAQSFEILAVASRSSLSASLDAGIHRLLRSHDRLLLIDSEAHDVALVAYGASQAQGELLFFTESHVVPEADTLKLADSAIRSRPGASGLSLQSCAVTHNRFSKAEAGMYQEDIKYGMEEHPWRKILDQCFVVWREPYFRAGGFCSEYGHFAEWLLAARMYALGYEVPYAPEARVWHYYVGNVNTLIEFTANFARGEIRYHAYGDEDSCRHLFDPVPQWNERLQLRTDLAWVVWKVVFKEWFEWPEWLGLLRWLEWLKKVRQATLNKAKSRTFFLLPATRRLFTANSAFILLVATLRLLRARMLLAWKLWFSADQQVHRVALNEVNFAVVMLERKRFVHRWLASHHKRCKAREEITSLPLIWEPESADDFPAIGIHSLEYWHGNSFRWSEQAAVIEVEVEAGFYRISLEWLPVRNVEKIELCINGHLTEARCDGNLAITEFRASNPGFVRLAWLCQPFFAMNDPRSLGLPLRKISWINTMRPN